MAFHPDKRNVLYVIRNNITIKFNYTLNGHTCESLEAKYLGLAIRENLKWEGRASKFARKPIKRLAFFVATFTNQFNLRKGTN